MLFFIFSCIDVDRNGFMTSWSKEERYRYRRQRWIGVIVRILCASAKFRTNARFYRIAVYLRSFR